MVQPVVAPKQNLGLATINLAFRLLKEHAWTTFGTAAVLCLPLAFIGVITALLPGIASTALQLLAGAIIGVWLAYAITVAVGLYFVGEDPGVGGLIRRSLSVGLVRFGFTSLLFNFVLGVIAFLALIPFFMSLASVDLGRLLRFNVRDDDIFRIFMGLLLSIPLLLIALLFAYLRLGLAPTASALDGTGPGASLGRSWTMTKGHLWEFFVLTFITSLITGALSFFVSGPATIVTFGSDAPVGSEISPDFFEEQLFGRELGPVEAVVTGISAYLTAALLTPFGTTMVATFFLLVRTPNPDQGTRQSHMVALRLPEVEGQPSAPPPTPPPVEPADTSPAGPEPPSRSSPPREEPPSSPPPA